MTLDPRYMNEQLGIDSETIAKKYKEISEQEAPKKENIKLSRKEKVKIKIGNVKILNEFIISNKNFK